MPYREGRRRFPDPSERRLHRQVINVYAHAQTDLTPVSQEPAEQVRDAMAPLLSGQAIPMVGERTTVDADPNLRDSR